MSITHTPITATKRGPGVAGWNAAHVYDLGKGELGWFDVRSYGADPTGVADSTSAIQATFNAAGTNGTILISPGIYRATSTITVGSAWSGTVHASEAQLWWYGAAGGTVVRWDASWSRLCGLQVHGQSVAATGIHLGAAVSPTSANHIAYEDVTASSCTDAGVKLGNYAVHSADIDLSSIAFHRCAFLNNRYGVSWQSAEALGVSFYDCDWTRISGTSLVESLLYMYRGGSALVVNGHMGSGAAAGDRYAIYVKDGWVTAIGVESEYGQPGLSGGGFLHLDTPAITEVKNYHPSVVEGCRVWATGVAGTGAIVRAESALHPLTLIGNHFNGKSSYSTPTVINAGDARIVSLGNVYYGNPGQASQTFAYTAGDQYFDGTSYHRVPCRTGRPVELSAGTYIASALSWDVGRYDCWSAGGAISVTLPLSTAQTSLDGTRLIFKKTSATSTVTIMAGTAETIDGAASVVLTKLYDTLALESNGQNGWHVVGWVSSTPAAGASSGAGSIKMGTASAADNAGWTCVAPGKFVPYWATPEP